VLWIIYVGAVILLLPVSAPATLLKLDGLQFGMLAFCCVNTLAAYGSFGEALYHWDMSRVSAVISTAPLFTIGAMWAVERSGLALVPAEGLNALSIAGALLVVAGSMTCALVPRN
jgi:drug/metabolite transporter (DMT)-like permease